MNLHIPLTEYHRPNGLSDRHFTTVVGTVTRVKAWQEIEQAGLRFTVENLRVVPQANVCLEDPEYGDFRSYLVNPDRTSCDHAIANILDTWSKEEFETWREAMDEA